MAGFMPIEQAERAPMFDVGYRQDKEYMKSLLAVLPELEGDKKCEDADREVSWIMPGIEKDIDALLAKCRNLTPVKASELLAEHGFEEAVRRGKKARRPTKGVIPEWQIKMLGHPDEGVKKPEEGYLPEKRAKKKSQKMIEAEEYEKENKVGPSPKRSK